MSNHLRYDVHIGVYRCYPEITAYAEGALMAEGYLDMMVNGYGYPTDSPKIQERALLERTLLEKARAAGKWEEVAYYRGYLSRFD